MGLVLWIDQNTFASSLVEKVYKKKGLPFYTISSVNDFLYLINDLNPEVIVLDSMTVLKNLETFKTQYNSMKKLPIITIGHENGLDFLENRIGEIRRPFDPFKVPELISNLLKIN